MRCDVFNARISDSASARMNSNRWRLSHGRAADGLSFCLLVLVFGLLRWTIETLLHRTMAMTMKAQWRLIVSSRWNVFLWYSSGGDEVSKWHVCSLHPYKKAKNGKTLRGQGNFSFFERFRMEWPILDNLNFFGKWFLYCFFSLGFQIE